MTKPNQALFHLLVVDDVLGAPRAGRLAAPGALSTGRSRSLKRVVVAMMSIAIHCLIINIIIIMIIIMIIIIIIIIIIVKGKLSDLNFLIIIIENVLKTNAKSMMLLKMLVFPQ